MKECSAMDAVEPAWSNSLQASAREASLPGPDQISQPIVYSTFAAEYIKNIAAQHYSIEDPDTCVLYHRGTSDIYRIFAGARSYALRLYRSKGRSPEDILKELRAIKRVSDAGASVALPIPRSDGSEITDIMAPEGVRSAVMFEWVKGRTLKHTESLDMTRYGAALATLHLAADTLVGDDRFPKLDIDYLFSRPLLDLTTRVRNISSLAKRVTLLGHLIQDHVQNAAPFLSDWGFCHGDIWAGNAHIDGTRVVLLDFELCGYGWRLAELAGIRYEAWELGVEDVSWRPFIEGYVAIRPVALKSLKQLGVFMILTCLWTAAYRIRLSETLGAEVASDEFVEHLVSRCERIETEVRQGRYGEEAAVCGR